MIDSLDLSSMRRICELRSHLEAFVARKAAEHVSLVGGTTEFRDVLKRLRDATRRGDSRAFHEADWDLHRALIRLADVPTLLQAWTVVTNAQESFSIRTLEECWPDLRTLLSEHEYLAEAVAAGDVYAAEDAGARHVDAVWMRLEAAKGDTPDLGDPLERAKAYLAFHFGRRITLDWLAREVAFASPGHLSRLFRQNCGVSFQTYLQELRLGKAAELLERTRLPVKRIAGTVGYADTSRFCQHFARKYGLTPLKYRQAKGTSGGW